MTIVELDLPDWPACKPQRQGVHIEQDEREFWIALGLWGAGAVTIFGTGLFGLIEGFCYVGSVFTLAGLGAAVYIAQHLKGKRLRLNSQHALIGALILTWVFLGYDIYGRRQQHEFAGPPSIAAGYVGKDRPKHEWGKRGSSVGWISIPKLHNEKRDFSV